MWTLTTAVHHSSNWSTSAHTPSSYEKAYTGELLDLSHGVQVSSFTTAERVTVQKDQ